MYEHNFWKRVKEGEQDIAIEKMGMDNDDMYQYAADWLRYIAAFLC